MAGKQKGTDVSMVLLVSGMTERSLWAIRLIREICDQNLSHYNLTVIDVYRDSSPDNQNILPVAPLLIGNVPDQVIAKIKQQAKALNFFLPVIRAQFIQVDEWRGNQNDSGSAT